MRKLLLIVIAMAVVFWAVQARADVMIIGGSGSGTVGPGTSRYLSMFGAGGNTIGNAPCYYDASNNLVCPSGNITAAGSIDGTCNPNDVSGCKQYMQCSNVTLTPPGNGMIWKGCDPSGNFISDELGNKIYKRQYILIGASTNVQVEWLRAERTVLDISPNITASGIQLVLPAMPTVANYCEDLGAIINVLDDSSNNLTITAGSAILQIIDASGNGGPLVTTATASDRNSKEIYFLGTKRTIANTCKWVIKQISNRKNATYLDLVGS